SAHREAFAFPSQQCTTRSRACEEPHTFRRCTMTRGALQKRKRKQVGEAPESLPTRACRTCTKAEAVPGSGRDDPLPGTRWLLPRNVSACSRSRAATFLGSSQRVPGRGSSTSKKRFSVLSQPRSR